MLTPKYPIAEPHRVIYRGYVETGEGQFPIKKTEDWIENLGTFEEKIGWASKRAFAASACFALTDIRLISQIKERKAQIARFAFYTVPLTAMGAGWMGSVELGKSFLGRDSLGAWVVGAIIPGGVFGIWRRCIYKGMRSSLFFAALGLMYQHSTNMNYNNNFVMPNRYNPNIPSISKNPFTKDYSLWNLTNLGTDKEWSQLPAKSGFQPKDPGPTWKKWEDEN